MPLVAGASRNTNQSQNATGADAVQPCAARRRVSLGLVAALASWLAAAEPAGATLLVFEFTGTILLDDLDVLFPGKNPGDSYSGSFTMDTDATQGFINEDGNIAVYQGDFDVTIESVSYPVDGLLVWSSGPSLVASDGFQFSFDVGILSGFLSLRSSSDIYALPLVPGAIELADMDELAVASLTDYDLHFDQGSITTLSNPVPEPATALLLAAGLAALASRRASG